MRMYAMKSYHNTIEPPASRNTGPASSFHAEHEMNKGARTNQQETVLRLVKLHPDHTSLELSKKSDLDRYQIARRLADLEYKGKVLKGRIRNCSSGRRAVAWRVNAPVQLTVF